MKIYTKTGDDGTTGLRGNKRVPKDHPRVAAYGDVDELNSTIGAALAAAPKREALKRLKSSLSRIQNELFHIGAVLSAPEGHEDAKNFPTDLHTWMEREIDRMQALLPPLKNFILPGGSPMGSLLHSARSVCRRAERSVIALGRSKIPAPLEIYLNRLSDYLFVAARRANSLLKKRESLWPGLKK